MYKIPMLLKVLVAQSSLTLCGPVDHSPLGFSVHGIFQARILLWVAISYSMESSHPSDQTWVFCIAGRFFTVSATRGAPQVLVTVLITENLFECC